MSAMNVFPESLEDAIGNDIQACGGFKSVAGKLWPRLKIESAYARLKNCLRDDKDEKLDPSELLLIKQWAREAGSRQTLDYELGACHCAPSDPVEPETEIARLLRDNNQLKESLEASNRRLEEALQGLDKGRF